VNHHHRITTSLIHIMQIYTLVRVVMRSEREKPFKGLISDSKHSRSPNGLAVFTISEIIIHLH
jgi:hypothetical protein